MKDSMQLFPALPPAVEAALRSSIERFGVLVPVLKDQHGRILDGHHRDRIAVELGIEYRTDRIAVADDEEAAAIVETLNTDRGHRLKSEMRRKVVADLRQEGHSLRAIAGAVGVTQTQVAKDLSTVNQFTVPDRITGLDGKSRPATRTVKTSTRSAPELPEADLLAEARRASLERREARRTERREAIEAMAEAAPEGERYTIITVLIRVEARAVRARSLECSPTSSSS